MDELIQLFNVNNIRYLVFGGQAVRLEGMPRFSMDWDVFIPGKDAENMQRINELLAEELDMPLVPVGPKGENLIQTYQTRWGIIQFHLAVAGIRSFDEAEVRSVEHTNECGIGKVATNRVGSRNPGVLCASPWKDLCAAGRRPQDGPPPGAGRRVGNQGRISPEPPA